MPNIYVIIIQKYSQLNKRPNIYQSNVQSDEKNPT